MALTSRFVSAIASLGVTLVVLVGMVTMGIISAERKREAVRALQVIDLAALKGSEDAEAKTKASEPQEPSPTMAAAPPPATAPVIPPPQPVPEVIRPVPVAVAAPAAGVGALPAVNPGAAAAASSAASAEPASAAPQPVRRGIRDGPDADAPPGTSKAYAARVRSWLLAHKRYPRFARMRKLEGVVRVHFVLDRGGRLIEGELTGSSGETSLDGEGEAMLRRASPYPAAPADVPGERISFSAAIEFDLND